MTDFQPFPKVPATAFVTFPDAEGFTLQEKMDGAQCGVELSADGRLLVHSRRRLLAIISRDGSQEIKVNDLGSFNALIEYVSSRAERILAFMVDSKIRHIYGEWMVKHTLDYPEHIWAQVYVYDLVDYDGKYVDPEEYATQLGLAGLQKVKSTYVESANMPGGPVVAAQEYAVKLGEEYRIEGVVIKDYQRPSTGEDRVWAKMVLPEFKEDHKANKMFPAPKQALTPEDRIAAFLPERTIEKAIEKATDHFGAWKPQAIPMVLELTWKDFLAEFMFDALNEAKYPAINTRTLHYAVQAMTRKYILERIAQ